MNIILAAFFSYGSINGDQTLASGDDTCTQVNFNFNFNYYGSIFTHCCIGINGYISFDDMTSYTVYINPGNSYFVAPFAHDLSTISNGSIYYRLTNNATILNQIGLEISSLKNVVNFAPTNALIVTWDKVAAFSWPINGYVSFQIILSTDGSNSFLTINYGSVEFSPSNGYSFQCGPDCYTSISNTNPEYSSNVGVNGKWIYNISNSKLKNKNKSNHNTPNSVLDLYTGSSLSVPV